MTTTARTSESLWSPNTLFSRAQSAWLPQSFVITSHAEDLGTHGKQVNTAAKKTYKVFLCHFVKPAGTCHYLFKKAHPSSSNINFLIRKTADDFINKSFFRSLKDLWTVLSEEHKSFMIVTETGVPPRQIVVILPQTGPSPRDL